MSVPPSLARVPFQASTTLVDELAAFAAEIVASAGDGGLPGCSDPHEREAITRVARELVALAGPGTDGGKPPRGGGGAANSPALLDGGGAAAAAPAAGFNRLERELRILDSIERDFEDDEDPAEPSTAREPPFFAIPCGLRSALGALGAGREPH